MRHLIDSTIFKDDYFLEFADKSIISKKLYRTLQIDMPIINYQLVNYSSSQTVVFSQISDNHLFKW